jgi:hypothetical protein
MKDFKECIKVSSIRTEMHKNAYLQMEFWSSDKINTAESSGFSIR